MAWWSNPFALISTVIGVAEKAIGFDVPGIGPGDKYFGGGNGKVTNGNGYYGGRTEADFRVTNGVVSHGGATCKPPYVESPATGRCTLPGGTDPGYTGTRKTEGARGAAERFFPGGASGYEVDTRGYGEAVIGGFGIPALVPAIVGAIERRDGSIAPIRKCPSGMVLATDELCYAKGTKGLAAHRKWKPSGACFLPPRDVKALRRAVAIRKSKSNRAMFRELGLG